MRLYSSFVFNISSFLRKGAEHVPEILDIGQAHPLVYMYDYADLCPFRLRTDLRNPV